MRKRFENLDRNEMRQLNGLIFDAWLHRLCSKYEGKTVGEGARWFLRQRSSA